MDKVIRDAQIKALDAFAVAAKTFALAGGTALELYYLKHRFSRDLDFFSPRYHLKEIDGIISRLKQATGADYKLENEFVAPNHAKVRFYSAKIKGTDNPLKIDFVEDVLFDRPAIERHKGVPVYSVKNIYRQKIAALTGTRLIVDATGRERTAGREEPRDAFDIYCLSKTIEPLHLFVKELEPRYRRGLVQWYRSYSRQEVKFGIHDLEIYDKKFDVSEMIRYLDDEVGKFIHEVIE